LRVVLAITGASGVVYGAELAKALKKKCKLQLVVTHAAEKVFRLEAPEKRKELEKLGKIYSENEVEADFASGSALVDAVVVCPCSMKTLSAIAHGYSYNSVARAADVMLKEKRKLVLVPREMPFSEIHLENMLKLSRMGVIIIPACPGFYHKPKKIEELVKHVVGKVMDSLGMKNSEFRRWRG